MSQTDALKRLRPVLQRAREEQQLSREALADLVAVRAPDADIDSNFIAYLETRRRSLPPRRQIEPLAESLGLTWARVLDLL